MKNVILFHFQSCPYCAKARGWIAELQAQYPELARLPIEMVDEKKEPARADQYDYWYVPAIFVDGQKVHEGAATRARIEEILRDALA